MGLEQFVFKTLIRETSGGRILCLGYPDLLVDKGTLTGCGIPEEALIKREDSEKIQAWHHWPYEVYKTEEALRALKYEPTFVDIKEIRGGERIVDLNTPLPDDLRGVFDVVLDGGTLEHCFNIAQGFKNVLEALKPGGVVIHVNPLTMINHGFWNICPTAYTDFYSQNNCQLLPPMALTGPLHDRKIHALSPTQRFAFPVEATQVVLAKKHVDGDIKFPTQTKYLKTPTT